MAVQQLHLHIDSISLESTSAFKTEYFGETGNEARHLKGLWVSAIKERENDT